MGWHHRLNAHESGQTPVDSEGQGSLSMGLQKVGHELVIEQRQQSQQKKHNDQSRNRSNRDQK